MTKTKQFYLAEITTDWADEMTIEAHVAMNQKEYNFWQKNLDKIKFPVTVGVGTNEEVDIFRDDIKVRSITESDYKTLKKLGLTHIGHTQCIEIENYGAFEDEKESDNAED